jgi:predicted  nucleic acid-binding Zn-ribbon protein
MADDSQQKTDQTNQDDVKTSDDIAQEALDQQTKKEVEASDDLAETVTSLQSLIERHAEKLDDIKNDLRDYRAQLRDHFESDAELAEAKQQQKEYRDAVKERKAKLNSDPTVTNLKVKISELSQERKEIQETLSDHLVNFYQLTNSKSFDTSDGDQREFTIKAKVR